MTRWGYPRHPGMQRFNEKNRDLLVNIKARSCTGIKGESFRGQAATRFGRDCGSMAAF